MTTIQYVHEHVLPAVFALLPTPLDTPEAQAMLLAIGIQESGFIHRRQVGGPAHGWWQFEKGGGVAGVLSHGRTRPLLEPVLRVLRYDATETACYDALTHNDVLAGVFARLLLRTVPQPLPLRTEPDKGWQQYLSGWRPGKPYPEPWGRNFMTAWEMVG